jgi:DNA polymerase III epsilon subunit-like protein
MNTVYVLDTETTGLAKTDQVIELSWRALGLLTDELTKTQVNITDYISKFKDTTYTERFFPSVSINPRALEVHGITLSNLKGGRHKPSRLIAIPADIGFLIGHNITFDVRLLLQSNPALAPSLAEVKLIDTLSLARVLNKQLDLGFAGHSLNYLTEWYYPDLTAELLTNIHSASMDILKTMLVLYKLIESLTAIETWTDLYNFQKTLGKLKS